MGKADSLSLGVYVYPHYPLSWQIASQAGNIRLSCICHCHLSHSNIPLTRMHSYSLFRFFLPTPAFLFSHLKHCQLLLLGSPYFTSDYLHMIVRLLPKFSLLILKRISTSVSLSTTQQSDSLCFLYFELPHCPSTSLSCSNSNCIHDFQSNDSSEGKQVKVARVWGLEGMLTQWITESAINWCQKDGMARYN